ncbi:MAG: 4Fe-4S dicluster domain-containing protein [Methanomassiliicoccales archaeon]|nr:MAG: 4Fe-4S dicluster domain-containing protein [Methanomassiliicoccales archaeon]
MSMKTTKVDKALREELGSREFTSMLTLCEQCGVCSGICPLSKLTDFRVRKMILKAGLGDDNLIESPDLWLCTMCYACLERCRSGIQVPEIISVLRTLAAKEGHLPDSTSKVAKLFLKTGYAFPISGLTAKMRKELGLGEMKVDKTAVKDVGTLAKKTGFKKLVEGP